MRRMVWLLPALAACAGVAWGQASAPAKAADEGVVVPVERGFHVLYVRVKINEKDAGWFLVDTGGQMTFVDRKVVQGLGLAVAGRAMVSGVGGSQAATFHDVDSLAAGGAVMGRQRVVGGDLSTLGAQFGLEIGGILAATFWKERPFTVDYQASTITFHDPARFAPPAGAVEVPLVMRDDHPHAEITVDGKYKGLFMLDTGASMPVTLNKAFMAKFPDVLKGRRTFGASAFGISGPNSVGRVKVDSLGAFAQTLNGVWAQYEIGPAPAGAAPGGVVGGPVLRQFRLTFDYAKGRLYAEYRPEPALKAPLPADFKVNAKDLVGVTPLMLAANDVRVDDARALLDSGADVAPADATGRTALFFAASRGSAELVRMLLDRKAPVNAKTKVGATALLAAVEAGQDDVVLMLLDAGAEVNAANNDGMTALVSAAMRGHAAMARMLLERGADANVANRADGTVLQAACMSGNVDIINALLAKGASVNAQDGRGLTALMIAAAAGHKEAVQTLLDHKADVKLKGKRGETVLMAANSTHQAEIAEMLKKAGAE